MRQKRLIYCLVVVLGALLAVCFLRAGGDPVPESGPALPRVVGETMPQATNARPNARVPLTPKPEPEASARTTIEVCVRNAATGAPEPGATVWFVKPGFDWAQLPPEQQELYSRATATFLRHSCTGCHRGT